LAVTSANYQGATNVTNAILRLPDVKTRTGLSRSTIYLRVSEGTFPEPIKLGDRAVGWIESEVEEWLQQLIEASRARFRASVMHHRAAAARRSTVVSKERSS
jgi:prophage regulatory protein